MGLLNGNVVFLKQCYDLNSSGNVGRAPQNSLGNSHGKQKSRHRISRMIWVYLIFALFLIPRSMVLEYLPIHYWAIKMGFPWCGKYSSTMVRIWDTVSRTGYGRIRWYRSWRSRKMASQGVLPKRRYKIGRPTNKNTPLTIWRCPKIWLPETIVKFPESPSCWELGWSNGARTPPHRITIKPAAARPVRERPLSEVTVPETFVAVVSLSSEKSLGPNRSGHRHVFLSEKMRTSTHKCKILVGETRHGNMGRPVFWRFVDLQKILDYVFHGQTKPEGKKDTRIHKDDTSQGPETKLCKIHILSEYTWVE